MQCTFLHSILDPHFEDHPLQKLLTTLKSPKIRRRQLDAEADVSAGAAKNLMSGPKP